MTAQFISISDSPNF